MKYIFLLMCLLSLVIVGCPQTKPCTCPPASCEKTTSSPKDAAPEPLPSELAPVEVAVEPTLPDTQPQPESIPKDENAQTLPIARMCGVPSSDFYTRYSAASARQTPTQRPVLCEELSVRTKQSLSLDPIVSVTGPAPQQGMKLLRILYTTSYPKGTTRLASALLYLPANAGQCLQQAPLAVVLHGTVGTAKRCAPSLSPSLSLDYMALPLVSQGFAVLVPDYIGLGVTSDVGHPYLVREPTVQAILDAVKSTQTLSTQGALRGCLGKKAILFGHSQGGHAALVTAAQWDKDISSITLAGTLAYAPAFGQPTLWAPALTKELKTTYATAYFLMYLLSLSRTKQAPAPDSWMTQSAAKTIPVLSQQLCFSELAKWLYDRYPTMGDIFQESWLKATQACQAGRGDCSSFQPWMKLIEANTSGAQMRGGHTLLVQGGKDTIVGSATVQCIEERLRKQKHPVQVCYFPTATHSNIVGFAWSSVRPWIEAVLKGETPTPPSCPSQNLPNCQ